MLIDKYIKHRYNDAWKIEYAKTMFFSIDKEPFDIEAYFQNEELAERIKSDHIKNVFKYAKFTENNIVDLLNSRIHMSNPLNFNDPFDSVFNLDIRTEIKKEVEALGALIDTETFNKIYNKAISDSLYDKINDMRSKTWVACFSEVFDSLLMWSHYTHNHEGFCIEYDFTDGVNFSKSISPVLYVDKIYDIRSHTFNRKWYNLCTLLKSVEWSYEKEWRIVIANLENDKLEYINVKKPAAIYIGACMKKADEQRLVDCSKQLGIETVYKMSLSQDNYKLIANRLDIYS